MANRLPTFAQAVQGSTYKYIPFSSGLPLNQTQMDGISPPIDLSSGNRTLLSTDLEPGNRVMVVTSTAADRSLLFPAGCTFVRLLNNSGSNAVQILSAYPGSAGFSLAVGASVWAWSNGTEVYQATGSISGGDVAWTDLTLLNSWTAITGYANTPGYYKDALGIVHLRGSLTGGDSTIVAVLPAGYQPSIDFNGSLYTLNNSDGGPKICGLNIAGVVTTSTSGQIAGETAAATGDEWYLDGISFPTL